MITKRFLPLAAALALTALGSTAHANFVSLTPQVQVVGVGSQVSFDINIDFVSTTVGGALDVFYDASLLSFVSFSFDSAFLAGVADPDFSVMPDNCFSDGSALGGCSAGDAELNGIGFGSFDGISGIHTVGTLVFDVLDIGVAVVTMATNDGPWGGFFSAVDASELTVVYAPAKVHVVPLPAGIWLLASGLMLFGGIARRRRT